MCASRLQEINRTFIYADNRINYLGVKNRNLTTRVDMTLDSRQAKDEFLRFYRGADPEIAVFLITNTFIEESTQERRPKKKSVLSLNKATWIWLLEEMQIHPHFVELLHFEISHATSFVSYESGDRIPEYYHILFRLPASIEPYVSVYLRFEFRTSKSLALIAGYNTHGVTHSIQEHLSELDSTADPFGILYNLVYRYFNALEQHTQPVFFRILTMLPAFEASADSYARGDSDEQIAKKYQHSRTHETGLTLRIMTWVMELQVGITDFLLGEYPNFLSLRRLANPNMNNPAPERHIKEALLSHRQLVFEALRTCKVAGERLQWQLNAMDSLNSAKIARQSQNTANESKTIAMETRRDSTSMKTIASLTMIYLPSTFAATMFSMVFFGISDATGALNVSTEIWKFIVAAAALTCITIVVWLYLNRYGLPTVFGSSQERVSNHTTEHGSNLSMILSDQLISSDESISRFGSRGNSVQALSGQAQTANHLYDTANSSASETFLSLVDETH